MLDIPQQTFNLADMTASADLKFVGDMATPGMTGRIDLTENGRVLFKERDFNVLRGSLRYDDPLTFDPLLDIALETSVITPEREVDIKYYITGLYSDWQTHTTSTPSLPQADINALLLFGMTTTVILIYLLYYYCYQMKLLILLLTLLSMIFL